jgi:hypothetical protein
MLAGREHYDARLAATGLATGERNLPDVIGHVFGPAVLDVEHTL